MNTGRNCFSGPTVVKSRQGTMNAKISLSRKSVKSTLGEHLRWGSLFALTLTALMTTGCTSIGDWYRNGFKVGPNYCKPAAPVSDQWIDFNNPAVIANSEDDRAWWSAFNDPTLNSFVQATYENNIPLHAQGQRILEYRAIRGVTVGNLFPQAQSLDGSYNRIQISENGNLVGVGNPTRAFDLYNFGPRMQWELDIWGRYRRTIEQANATLDQQIELYDDILAIAVADTAKAYTTLRVSQEMVRLAKRNVEIQEGSFQLAKARFEEGATSELDVTQAQSTLSETQALIPKFETTMRQANNELCLLMGMPAYDLSPQVGDGPLPTAPKSVAAGIPGELLRRRPDIRAAERAVAGASAEIGIATSELYPHFSIDGVFGWTASDASDLFRGTSFGGLISPTFRWNLLNYGRLRNNVSKYEARFQTAAFNYQQTVLKANNEVENALISFIKSQERAKQLQEASAATQKSVDLALIQYKEGSISFERIFNLQNVLIRQQIDLASAQGEINLALIDIHRALRGGWQIRLQEQGEAFAVSEVAPSESPMPTPVVPATEELMLTPPAPSAPAN
jgi:NodT family efflux transporter outer membrane factor (OMF) lipoprotein